MQRKKTYRNSKLEQRKLTKFFSKIGNFGRLVILLITICLSCYFFYNYLDSYKKNKIDGILHAIFENKFFALENVYLEGQKKSSTKAIIAAAELKIGDSIFKKSVEQIKENIDNVPWVLNSVIYRKLPNSLYIGIMEREPIGIWQYQKKLYLFDINSVKINYDKFAEFKHLPILICDDINLYINELYPIISKNKELYSKITSIIRISERRWNVRFNEDLEIKLPEENLEEAWNILLKINKNNEFLNDDVISIDLRTEKRIFIEKKK